MQTTATMGVGRTAKGRTLWSQQLSGGNVVREDRAGCRRHDFKGSAAGFASSCRLHLSNGGDEPVSAPRDRDDLLVGRGTSFERLSNRRNVAGEIVVFDDRIRPDELHELVLFHDLPSSLDQDDKNFKCLGRY